MRGVLMLPFTFLLMKFVIRPKGGVWMPSTCSETDCRTEDLSPRFWQATEAHRKGFEQLGFAPCFYSKLRRNLNPAYVDEGAVSYLHSNHCHLGTVVFARLQVASRIRERVVIGFAAAFEAGSVTFTNSKGHFDALPGRQTMLVQSGDPAFIYERFASHLSKHGQPPRVFANCDAVRQWLDQRRLESFEARVARGLYVRMTDEEVEQARRKIGF